MSEQASMDAFLQLMEATEEMQGALCAAAKLLKDCTCQKRRAAESLAAVRLADQALSKWLGAKRAMMNIFRADMQREIDQRRQ